MEISRPDSFVFKIISLGLILGLSATFSGLFLEYSIEHSIIIYADLFILYPALIFFLFYNLVKKPIFSPGLMWVFFPVILLWGWWFTMGFYRAANFNFFLFSLLQFFSGIVAALIIPVFLKESRYLIKFLNLFLIFSILISGIAVIHCLVDPKVIFISPRTILLSGRAYLGLYMLVVVCVSLYVQLNSGGKLSLAALFLAILVILLSGSRSTLMASIIMMVPYFFQKFSMKKFLLISACVTISVIILFNVSESRMVSTQSFEINEEVNIDASAGRRLLMWMVSWEMITNSNRNFFTGVGFSNYRWVYDDYLDLPFYTNGSHNMFLHVWSESGLVGLVIFLMIFVFIIVKCYRLRIKSPPISVLTGLQAGILLTCFTQETLLPVEVFANFNVLYFMFCAVLIYHAEHSPSVNQQNQVKV